MLCCSISSPVIGAGASDATIPYTPLLSGISDLSLRREIEAHSQLFQLKSHPAFTVAEIKERAMQDMQQVLKILNVKGYYNAQVDYSVNYQTDPITVNFMVNLGVRYTIQKFSLSATSMTNVLINHISMDPSVIGIQVGQPADMETLRAAVKKLFILLGDNGYPYAKIQHEEVTVDHDTRGMNVTLFLDAGRLMHFGTIAYTLAPGMDEKFIKDRLQWKEGDVYSNMKVMQTVEVLNNTGMYSYVKISRPPEIPNDDKVKMMIEAAPSHPRDVSWSIGHQGTLGVAGSVGWKGTNVLGEGDYMEIKATVGEKATMASYEHIVPDVLWPETTFKTRIDFGQKKWQAFRAVGASVSGIFTTPLIDQLVGYGGYAVTLGTIKPRSALDDHSPVIMTLPLGVAYSWSDDPRFPRKGWSISLDLQPSMQVAPNHYFVQGTIQQKAFYPLTEDKRLVLSGWYHLGMSPGVGRHILPLDRRYFVGGYGTVRGYGDQMAGPLGPSGTPLGGRSMVAFGTEVTYYASPELAVLGFIDAGTSYSSNYPNFAHRLFVGVGAGLRYKTPVGDIHVDLAFPINRRPQDQKAQIYVGIEQPF